MENRNIKIELSELKEDLNLIDRQDWLLMFDSISKKLASTKKIIRLTLNENKNQILRERYNDLIYSRRMLLSIKGEYVN